ncbi:hypothetical protein EDC01DRAFT_409691 [Geopyxis carbonaria]|nr:hypothetical protein EDC01DRAFT_409691 [Geopyxis carbonaria]
MSNPSASEPSSSNTTSSQSSLQQHFASLAPPPLTAHLTDSTSHIILSTATVPRQSHSLQSLTHAYLAAHDTAGRMGLGVPLRVTLTTKDGTAVIQSATRVEQDAELVVGTVVGPEDKMAEARVASWGVEEVGKRVGKVIAEGRREQ